MLVGNEAGSDYGDEDDDDDEGENEDGDDNAGTNQVM